MNLSACGGSSKWLGTYGVTSTSGIKLEFTINKNGSVIYLGVSRYTTWLDSFLSTFPFSPLLPLIPV